jgi:hypothetical protein
MTNEEWKRAEMLGNVMDQLWANALRAPRHSGSAPSRVSPSRPSGECRLSQGEK